MTRGIIESLPDFCVYCGTAEDQKALFGMVEHDRYPEWSASYACYRIHCGKVVGYDSMYGYEEFHTRLPKFTFTASRVELPELEIPDAGELF